MEHDYNFHELVGCANTLNHLSIIEYGGNGLQFGRVHNKQKNIWVELHPPLTGEMKSNLGDILTLQGMQRLWRHSKKAFVRHSRC